MVLSIERLLQKKPYLSKGGFAVKAIIIHSITIYAAHEVTTEQTNELPTTIQTGYDSNQPGSVLPRAHPPPSVCLPSPPPPSFSRDGGLSISIFIVNNWDFGYTN